VFSDDKKMGSNRNRPKYAIETSNLNLWYGDFQALLSVSSKIKAGIITSLIGPSGCGKTTLLRCFNRMNERFDNVRVEGSVEILGSNIYEPEVSIVELRKRVGMVFQRPNPLPLSIYDNVAFGLKVHSPRRILNKSEINASVEKALKKVFLFDSVKDKLRRKGTELQLEQQQKLCIARLLPLKPEVLLMDEPCSALDAAGTEAVEELLMSLRGQYTIVIVTHNMAQARRISDECIYMLNGELIEHGETSSLFLNPEDKRTEEYIEGRYG